jgi:hypothetical protein
MDLQLGGSHDEALQKYGENIVKLLARLALLCSIGGITLFASPLCTSFRQLTAADMQALGQSGCQFGDKIFYNFTYTYSIQDPSGSPSPGDVNTPAVPGSAVLVEFSNLGGDPLKPVLSLVGTWQVSDGHAGDITVNYQVQAPISNAMYFSWMLLTGQVSNVNPEGDFASYVSGAETICCPAAGGVVSLGTELFTPETITPLTAYTSYDGKPYDPATMIQISKNIFISSGTGANQAIVTRIDQGLYELSDVPEPWNGFLMGGGLTLVGVFRSRRRKNALQK